MATDLTSQYPESISLANGSDLTIKVMTKHDQSAIAEFARNLPEEDLLFLTMDLTQQPALDRWANAVDSGRSISLLAFAGDSLVGYATVHRETAPWLRQVGEIRVNIAPALRSEGLGRLLISRIYDIAHSLGLTKLLARMTVEQTGARAVFRKLGFVPEALLSDFVVDTKGMSHDLVMMTYDIDGLSDQAGAPVKI